MKPTITVVSLGPGDPELMTLRTADALRAARRLILRTGRHRCAEWLREQGIPYETYDAFYDRYEDFDAMHAAMAEALWREAAGRPLVWAVQDALTDGSVAALRASMPEGASLKVLPGVSAADVAVAHLPPELPLPAGGLRSVPARYAASAAPDPAMPLLVTELDSRILAGEVKLALADLYGDEHTVCFLPSMARVDRKPLLIPLCELDRQPAYDHTVQVYVPAAPLNGRERYCFADLLAVMAALRAEDGCPWDREQTHQSLRKYLIEEACEAAEAIDEGDMDHLADELGDVLLQVVFHADIGRSHGEFTVRDVTTAICRKMIRRHPFLFGDADVPEDADRAWEDMKRGEKGYRTESEVLAGICRALPAVTRAIKVLRKTEELRMLSLMPGPDDATDAFTRVGDALFYAVQATRECGLDPDETLHAAVDRFIADFTRVENAVLADGKRLKDLTLPEMHVYLNTARGKKSEDAPAGHAPGRRRARPRPTSKGCPDGARTPQGGYENEQV